MESKSTVKIFLTDKSETESPPREVEDADLSLLRAKRLLEMRKRMASTRKEETAGVKEKKITDREVLLKALTDRGNEVLSIAEANYPREMSVLIPRLAQLVREGKVPSISGGELLQFLRSLGLRVSVPTSISVAKHGKLVSLADKLKEQY